MTQYETIIGMEIHVELATRSKMFCGCPADHFAKKPNSQTCPVCLAMPGGLPVPNKKAIEWTIKLGLALGCEIPLFSKFDRKHYFYPDLPKGYQISQYDKPFAVKGKLGGVRINRVHLEEDTGKLIHSNDMTLVDFNRSGVALVEIVTEPDIHGGEEAKIFLKKLYQTIRYLGISDADMEKGSMRLEPNISVRPIGTKKLPNYKVEVKNINSFNFVKKAIEYEVKRHISLLEQGKTPVQETRGWMEGENKTVSQRIKESADDYRYFPEPDIPPMRWTTTQISELRTQIPELPFVKLTRFKKEYALNEYDAGLLTDTIELANYFEECVKLGNIPAKKLANWIINRKVNIDEVLPATLVKSIMEATTISSVSAFETENIIRTVVSQNAKAVEDYKKGKEQAIMFLVGQCMKEAKGKASAEILKNQIEKFIKTEKAKGE